MSDIVGSASVTINPDVSDFASNLASALGPALQAVETDVAAAAAQMTSDLESVAVDASSAFDGISSSIDPALAAAAATVASESGAMTADLEGIANAAVNSLDEIPQATEAATSAAAADVASASAQMSDSIKSSIGPAAAETAAAGRDEFGRFVSDSTAAGQSVKDNVGAQVLSLADVIKGVAIGNLIADGIKGGVDIAITSIGALVSAIPSIGAEIQSSFNTIRVATGSTGPMLDDLKQTFNDLASTTPAGLDQVGDAIATVNQRLDLTGQPLEDVARGMLRLSSLTGTDLNQNLQTITGIFNNFNVSADQQAGKLDELFRVYQATGIPVAQLTSSMATLGPITRQLGLSFEDTASLIGNLNKAGLDAGTIQMGLTKVLKAAADEGVSGGTKLTQVFEGIKSGLVDQSAAIDLFGPRGIRLFDLIKSGTLDYQGLSAAIGAGGDTLKQAAGDTKTWQGQLAILGNQLKIILEPIAVAVFNAITTAVAAVRPVIAALAQVVYDTLVPVWQQLVVVLLPVWQMFDRIREGVASFITVIGEGGSIFDGIRAFFVDLTGSEDTADGIVAALTSISDTIVDLWAKLQPVRDAIAGAFTTIRDAVASFVSDHPEIALGALAGIIGGALLAAVIALGGAIVALGGIVVGFIAPLVAAAAPFILIGAAVGALVVALVEAYNNIEPFRNAIDSIVSAIRDGALVVFAALSDAWDHLWPLLVSGAQSVANVWMTTIWPALQGLFESLQPLITWAIDHWQLLVGVFFTVTNPVAAIIAGLGILYAKSEAFRNIVNGVIDVLKPLIAALLDIAGHIIGDVINAVSGLIDILTGLFTWDWDKVKDGFLKIATAIVDLLANIGQHLLDALAAIGPVIGQWALSIITSLPQWFGNIGAVLLDILENAFVGLGQLLVNIPQWLGDLGAILVDWLENAFAGLGTLLTNIPQWLGDVGAILWDWIQNGFMFLVTNIPTLLSMLGGLFGSLLSNIPGWLGDLGSLLLGWLGDAVGFLVSAAGSALSGLWDFITGIPGQILNILSTDISFLATAFFNAVSWLVDNGPGMLSTLWGWITSIPAGIISALSGLKDLMLGWLSDVWSWLVTNGPGLIAGFVGWLMSLPGKFIELLAGLKDQMFDWLHAAWDWLVDNGPTILAGFVAWVTALPGKLLGLLSGFKDQLFDWIHAAFQWVVDNGPTLIQGLIDFFTGLPGRIFDAIKSGLATAGGAIADVAKSLWNAIAGFVNDKLINPMKTFAVDIGPYHATPFEFIPSLPLAAKGGIYDQPYIGGEAGVEAAIPLTNERRAVEVAQKAGIPQMLARAGVGGQAPIVVSVAVTVEATPDTTYDHAQMIGKTVGESAGDAAAEQLAIAAAIHGA